jgi:hypothetical protein
MLGDPDACDARRTPSRYWVRDGPRDPSATLLRIAAFDETVRESRGHA